MKSASFWAKVVWNIFFKFYVGEKEKVVFLRPQNQTIVLTI